jgi:hypothetical protein
VGESNSPREAKRADEFEDEPDQTEDLVELGNDRFENEKAREQKLGEELENEPDQPADLVDAPEEIEDPDMDVDVEPLDVEIVDDAEVEDCD